MQGDRGGGEQRRGDEVLKLRYVEDRIDAEVGRQMELVGNRWVIR